MSEHIASREYRGFSDPQRVNELARLIEDRLTGPLTLMEVCGTHTMSIAQYGIKSLLPKGMRLLSGPGCPVCVTDASVVSMALAIAKLPGVILASFGDMLRVPAGEDSLQRSRDLGADIRVVLSPLDAVGLALRYPKQQVVFLAVGFETTAPLTAATLVQAAKLGIDNLTVIPGHKTMPVALQALLGQNTAIDGLICPGHVAAVTGAEYFRFLPQELGKGAAVAGFEPEDIMLAIASLTTMAQQGRPELRNCYPRAVRPEGNRQAMAMMEEVFTPCDAVWRGLGLLPDSGLALRGEYERFDAAARFAERIDGYEQARDHPGCCCGAVLRGEMVPADCPLFGKACTPATPCGACMVSSEGSCAAYYRYSRPAR